MNIQAGVFRFGYECRSVDFAEFQKVLVAQRSVKISDTVTQLDTGWKLFNDKFLILGVQKKFFAYTFYLFLIFSFVFAWFSFSFLNLWKYIKMLNKYLQERMISNIIFTILACALFT
jgi:hypothetical protein